MFYLPYLKSVFIVLLSRYEVYTKLQNCMVAVSGYRFVRYNGTDWCDALVPIHPLQWYQLVRNVGTDSSATVVPIRRYYHLLPVTLLSVYRAIYI